MDKITVLVLASNPVNTGQLRLDKEFREIKDCLERCSLRDRFEVKNCAALRVTDLRQALLKESGDLILHFSGHGEAEGLVLEDEKGKAVLVKGDALASLFGLFKDQVKCVVLNACYSDNQSQAIHEHINFVVGMNKAIGDKAAIEFAKGFYDGLGAGRTYPDSFKLGTNSIDLSAIPEHTTPVLLKPSYDILIVDDDENWRDLLESAFLDIYSFHNAKNYKEAKEKLEEYTYRLICSNWNIQGEGSGLTGRRLLRYLEKELPTIPVILITGVWVGDPLRVQRRFPNVKGFLLKGTSSNFLEDLEMIVSEVLE